MIQAKFNDFILSVTAASSFRMTEEIQGLWSGYGQIVRLKLDDARYESVVLKQIRLTDPDKHPRGWNTDISHQRKLKSYQVEANWYQHWSQQCDTACRVPECYGQLQIDDDLLIVLEDLDAAGFSGRLMQADFAEMELCLNWLAAFHARFLHQQVDGLWGSGTYWHLQTRPDELQALSDKRLQQAAGLIDQRLSASPFQTLVHGDAKLANFCFDSQLNRVAAVDFQYVGRGCGMKDVAYFISSCLSEDECQKQESDLLDCYFLALKQALKGQRALDVAELEQDWRALYPYAWTDFFRFLKGWSPGHWKIHGYSQMLASQVLNDLGLD